MAAVSITAVSRTLPAAILLPFVAAIALGWLLITKTQGGSTLAATADLRGRQAVTLTQDLTRTVTLGDGNEVQAILATPDFFRATGRMAEATQLGADRAVVFVLNESSHYTGLHDHLVPILRTGGVTYLPTETKVLSDAEHHRTSAFVYGDVPAARLGEAATWSLVLPSSAGDRATLDWSTPVAYPSGADLLGGLNPGLLLAIAAGLLASIAPCLVQLTAFYLPTLAGVGAGDASAARGRLVRTAAIFVAGFTVPYTVGGAIIGGFGEAVVRSGVLTPTSPLAFAAGIVMIGMAVVVAYRAKAPLVCKLPLPSAVGGTRTSAVATFVSGFAIATGCLACFGGAIMGVLLVYTGVFGSALLGGAAMLLFSLGIAVPFLAAAFGAARVLPLALRLQRAAPAIGLATSAVMLFFGVEMASGNFHAVSGWIAQHLPVA